MAPKMKALRKDEDLAAIPLDQPVLVDLEPIGGEVDDPNDKSETIDGAQRTKEDPGVIVLKDQLELMRKAREASDARAADFERRANQAERERADAVNSQSRTEVDAVQSGLQAAQSEKATAEQAVERAGEAGDWKAMAEATARVGRAAADIREFERSAALLADRKEQVQEQPRQQAQQPIDIMSAIDSNPQLLPTEKEWLKAHPEAFGSRNKELDVAYDRAMRKGLSRGTPDYFDFMDEFMGYAKPQAQDDDAMVSAPVHRNDRGGDGRPANGKIMLTPEERDMAKSMGVSDIEYARQKVAFEAARKIEPAKYGDR